MKRSVMERDHRTAAPATETISPDVRATTSEERAIEPDERTIEPEVRAIEPERRAIAPERRAIEAEASAIDGEATTYINSTQINIRRCQELNVSNFGIVTRRVSKEHLMSCTNSRF